MKGSRNSISTPKIESKSNNESFDSKFVFFFLLSSFFNGLYIDIDKAKPVEIATKLKFLIDENIIKKEIFVKNIQNEFYDRKINEIDENQDDQNKIENNNRNLSIKIEKSCMI